jgi:hypothetical protein
MSLQGVEFCVLQTGVGCKLLDIARLTVCKLVRSTVGNMRLRLVLYVDSFIRHFNRPSSIAHFLLALYMFVVNSAIFFAEIGDT